jgi:hypothetical protein
MFVPGAKLKTRPQLSIKNFARINYVRAYVVRNRLVSQNKNAYIKDEALFLLRPLAAVLLHIPKNVSSGT